MDLLRKMPTDSCLLCGGSSDVIGIFRPHSSEDWGAPEGKDRFFRYCLCHACNGLEDKAERVEKVIGSNLSSGTISCNTH